LNSTANNGEERENTTLHPTNNQTASAIPRRSRTPPTNRSIVATHEPITRVDETALPSKSSTQLIGEYDTHPSTICVTAQCSGAVDNRDTTIIDDEVESTSLVEVLSSNSPVLGEQQAISRPGRPQKDPPLSPRERTRLRVQRHRDQQHLTRAQQIIQQFDITQESPPTVELSALTLRDDLDSSILPDKVQPRPDRTSDNESDLESEAAPTLLSSSPSHLTAYAEDGNDDDTPENFGFNNDAASDSSVSVRPLWTGSARHNSQSLQRRSSAFSSTSSSRVSSSSPSPGPSSASSAGGDESILSGYLQVIREQDTAGGPDFLRAQSVVYDRVLRTFFNHQCNCKPYN
jgi:hypothetical protein